MQAVGGGGGLPPSQDEEESAPSQRKDYFSASEMDHSSCPSFPREWQKDGGTCPRPQGGAFRAAAATEGPKTRFSALHMDPLGGHHADHLSLTPLPPSTYSTGDRAKPQSDPPPPPPSASAACSRVF